MKVKKVRVRFVDGTVREYFADSYEIRHEVKFTSLPQVMTQRSWRWWFKKITVETPGESYTVRHVACHINGDTVVEISVVQSQLDDPRHEPLTGGL